MSIAKVTKGPQKRNMLDSTLSQPLFGSANSVAWGWGELERKELPSSGH